ncbi:MAG: DNA internalization-related competence protein ComEC/Rec2 [candidate division KSB1 bacterium]|nr:DNA internalization-related competence protein ComEC/Rec2 [candidate division KSB1 bacterium]
MARRPAFFLAIAFCLGIWLDRVFAIPETVCAAGFILLVAGFFFSYRRQPESPSKDAFRAVDVLLLAACLAAGALRSDCAQSTTAKDIGSFADPSREVLLYGKVDNFPEPRRGRWQFPFAVQRIRTAAGWVTTRGRVLVSADSLGDVQVGEALLLHGFLRLADGSRNPGAFDYRAYLQAQGISALFRCRNQTPLWREKPGVWFWWWQAVGRAKIWIDARLAGFSRDQNLALLRGLLIGEREEISPEVMETFSRTGLVHILAVSGSNVGFIALIIFIVLSFLRVPRRWHLIFLLPGIVFYMYLTGAQPPVVRATIMAAVIIIGEYLERDADIYNSLGVAALVILLWQPLQLFQLGFQLTFMAVLGIAYLYRPLLFLFTRVIRTRWRPIRLTMALLAVSFAAQLATLPFSVHAFGRLPVMAIFGNLLVIPAAFIIVATACAACAFSFIDFCAQAFGIVADLAAGMMITFTRWLAAIPLAYVDGIHVSPWLLLFYVLVITACVEWRRTRLTGRRLLIAGLLVLNIFIWQQAWAAGPKMRVTFFDVGQGDAALLELPAGRLMIDAGPLEKEYDAAARVLVPFFRRSGIRQLEAVVISHPHADHLGGLPTLLHEIRIKKVYVSGLDTNSPLEQQCRRLMDSLHVPSVTLHAGQCLADFAPAQVWALHPRRQEIEFLQVNDASLIIKVIFGRQAFLFPGDAEAESEKRLLRFAPLLKSEVLKVGHHGSNTSSTPPFLKAVNPRWAVASVGRWNNLGLPDPQVMARYDSLGIQLARTDRDGAVLFETDGRTLKRIR